MDSSIVELQRGFLTDTQIEASRMIMGIDTQLIDDDTYFVVEIDGQLAGAAAGSVGQCSTVGVRHQEATARCSIRRPTPVWFERCTRHLRLCDGLSGGGFSGCASKAARTDGFGLLELMATRSARPLYEAFWL